MTYREMKVNRGNCEKKKKKMKKMFKLVKIKINLYIYRVYES